MNVLELLARLYRELHPRKVEALLIGVAGANLYARSGHSVFSTEDQDLLLPLDPEQLLAAWHACEARGLRLVAGQEPLDLPRDRYLAERVVAHRATTRATDGELLHVDLTFSFGPFSHAEAWPRRHVFRVDGVDIPTASLSDIVRAKAALGRPKDHMFLTSHADMLREWLRDAGEDPDDG